MAFGELGVGEVVAAVAELAVVDGGFLGPFAGLFLDAGNFFAFGLGGFDLVLDDGNDLHVHVEVVVQVLGDEVVHEGADRGTAVYRGAAVGPFDLLFPHVGGAELGLGLAFEDGLLDLDGDGAHNALADILGLVVFFVEVFEGLGDGFAVGGQMGAAVACVLAVDEGGDVFAVAVAVGEDDLDVFAFQVDEGIKGRLAQILGHEVQEAVLTLVGNAVQVQGKALFEVGVVLDHALHEFHVEGIVVEHLFVRREADEGAALFGRGLDGALQEVAPGEMRPGALALAVGGDVEVYGHGVDGLGAHTVHTHALLEVGVVEFAAGVQLRGGVHDFPERNAAAEVPDGDGAVLDGDVDPLAVSHGEFVDGVVDDLLQEDVDAVALTVSVSEPADVHAGAAADVLVPFQGLDGIVVIAMVDCFCHLSPSCLFYKVNKNTWNNNFCAFLEFC